MHYSEQFNATELFLLAPLKTTKTPLRRKIRKEITSIARIVDHSHSQRIVTLLQVTRAHQQIETSRE